MKIRDIIILGAGASKSEGAPLQKEYLKNFLNPTKKSQRVKERVYQQNKN